MKYKPWLYDAYEYMSAVNAPKLCVYVLIMTSSKLQT